MYSFVKAWEGTQEVGGTSGQADFAPQKEDSVSPPVSPRTQQIQLTWWIIEECNMTSTGSSSATATGTSSTCAIFWPMKPIMGSLVQIKSDTFAAWMGGISNSDRTDLKISTADLQQSSQIHPMLDDSSFHE